jgi:hypothetical protein
MTIEVRPLSFPRDAAAFTKAWWGVYQNDPHWVPPLIFERKAFFDIHKHPYYQQATVQAFGAYRNNKMIATIGACADRRLAQQIPGMGTFGFFEFPDDVEVAGRLFEAAKAWLREQGCNRLMGPCNWSTNHEFALLVDGFDTDPCVANPHNSAHFPKIYAQLGLKPNMTWYAYWMDYGPEPPRIARIAERLLERNKSIQIRDVRLDQWDSEMEILRDIYNDAWHENWGHVAVSPQEFEYLAASFRPLVQRDLCYVVEVEGKPAGVSVTFPDYNQIVKKMNGRLFPFGWYHYQFGRQNIDALRVFILGVKQEYHHLPLGAPMYARTWRAGVARKVKGAEASLILHHNVGMRGALEKLGAYVYKTYQSFEAKITDDAPDVTTDPGEIVPGKPKGWSLTPEGKAALDGNRS